jgi:hypothetical protein
MVEEMDNKFITDVLESINKSFKEIIQNQNSLKSEIINLRLSKEINQQWKDGFIVGYSTREGLED